MISIEGSVGGGQLLRTALSLSSYTNKPFTIQNIRGKREKSGLKPQHLTAIHAIQKLCNAKVKGDSIESKTLTFHPSKVKGGNFKIDIGTAGSTTLILQTLIPACIHEQSLSKIEVTGGTDTKWCPMSMYFKHIFLDFLKRIGINFTFEINKFGFFPKGGGKLTFTIQPSKTLKEINFTDRGKLKNINLTTYSSKELQSRKVNERLIKAFQQNFKKEITIENKYINTLSTGCFIHSNLEYENYTVGDGALGELRKSSEDIGKDCAEKINFLLNSQGVDYFAADQLLIYMAMKGKGKIKASKITNHVKTNADLIEKFLPVRFNIKDNEITCRKV